VKILKRLCEAVRRKIPELWPKDWILQLTRHSLSRSFWNKNWLPKWNTHSIPLMWHRMTCISKNKACFNGTKISGYWRHPKKKKMLALKAMPQQKSPKIFPTVAVSLGPSALSSVRSP
jgi:hypothetical protein